MPTGVNSLTSSVTQYIEVSEEGEETIFFRMDTPTSFGVNPYEPDDVKYEFFEAYRLENQKDEVRMQSVLQKCLTQSLMRW